MSEQIESNEQPDVIIRYVYHGVRFNGAGGKSHVYSKLNDTGDIIEGSELWYKKPYLKNHRPGHIVKVIHVGDTGRYWSSGAKAPAYDGWFKDNATVQTWTFKHEAVLSQERQKQLARKSTNRDVLGEMTLGQARQKFRDATALDRRAILVLILSYIQSLY